MSINPGKIQIPVVLNRGAPQGYAPDMGYREPREGFWIVFSKSSANLLHLPSHAKVRSTTHLRGMSSKPSALPERLTVSIFRSPILARAFSIITSLYHPVRSLKSSLK